MIKKITVLFVAQLLFSTVLFASTDTTSVNKNEFEFTSEMIQNVVAKEGEESAKIFWSLDHEAYTELKKRNAKVIITYNTKLGKERIKEGLTGSEWKFTEPIDLDEVSYEIEDLVGNENYLFKVGFTTEGTLKQNKKDKEKMVWSEEAKCKTERSWGIAKLLILIGSLGFFIYGMKVMSEGLQQASGSKLRSMLGSITSNRFKGVLTGFSITSIIQSSSVTTVMTVSFVNAGLMTLRQSAGVMMGANIGTTITAWIVLLLGFKVSISSYAFMIIALATPLLFLQKGKSKALASAIFGFCILFLGLDELQDAVPALDASSSIVQFFIDFKDAWYGPLMFVFLGAFVTIIIQSSSAAMALTLTMVAAGTIPFEVACAMVLGENIGTTITAELASLVANVHAKRSARIHSLFNIIGVCWMLLVFPFALKVIGYLVAGDDFDPKNVIMAGSGIALFHTLFNTANVIVLIGFVPQLCRLAERTVKSRGESDEEFKLDYIDGPLGSTAELCILEATKEVAKFGKITAKMNGFVRNYINTSDKKIKAKMLKKIAKYEEITDRVEVEIGNYLGKTSRLEMSDEASKEMRGMLNIATDLERIGDIYYQMGRALEKKDDDKQYFTPEQRKGINKMLDATEKAFDVMNDNLRAEYGKISLEKARACEKDINKLRNELRKQHLTQFETGDINMNSALVYSNIFSSFEKVGDHIINVSEAVAGENIH